MRRPVTLITVVLLGFVLLGNESLRSQSSRFYRVEDIGTLGTPFVEGLAINDNGDIAGHALLPSGEQHAFRYTDARGIEDLGGDALGVFSQAFGINNAGDVVGLLLDSNFNEHGFLAPAGSAMQDVFTEDRPIGMLTSILDDGRMAGRIDLQTGTPTGERHAFRTLQNGDIHDLGSPGFNSTAWRMNAAGQVTGNEAPVTWPTSGRFTAFRFSDSAGKTDLGTFGGRSSFALFINAANVIVGCASLNETQLHAFRAREGSPLEDLGTLGGESSCAEGINDSGEIVGWSDRTDVRGIAMVYTDAEGMIDLNSAVPADLGLRLVFARAINNRGQIVAVSATTAGLLTYRLTPIERDSVPPVITSASVAPAVLWPPNGNSVAVTVSVAVSDNIDPAPRCQVTSVSVLENGSLVPDAQGDAQVTGDLTLALRAQRSGGTVRTYPIVLTCSDATGNQATTSVTVTVPDNMSGGGGD